MKQEIFEKIKEKLNNRGKKEIGLLTSIESLKFDSIEFISFIVEVEEEFDIELPDEYLQVKKLKDIDTLVSIVASRYSEKQNVC